MFIFEILIYVFFTVVMCFFAKQSQNRTKLSPDGVEKASNKLDKYLWYYILFFTIISAIRWKVGTDSNGYIYTFQVGLVRKNSEEFLWDWIVLFVKNNGLHFAIGTGIAAFLQIFLLTESLKKYRSLLIWLPVVLFGGRYYLDLMNAVRQMIAACGFLYFSQFIVKRKPIHYFVGIILLAGFHHSALILLPVYLLTYIPLKKIKLSDRRYICLSIFIVCFILGQTPSFQNLIKYIEPVLTTTGYDHYINFYTEVLSGYTKEHLSFGPIMLSYFLLSLAVIWWGPKLAKTYSKTIPFFNLWYVLSFIYSCGYFLVCNVSHIMLRPIQYFEFFLFVMILLLINYFYINKKMTSLLLFILLIWMNTFINIYKQTDSAIDFATYKTYFNHIY